MILLSKTLAVLLLLLSVSSLLTVTTQGTPTWNTQIIDPKGESGILVLDSNDKPHILYSVLSDWDIHVADNLWYYAVWNGKNWTTQYITKQPLTTQHNIDTVFDLKLDHNDNPQIIYTGNNTIFFLACNGTKWAIKQNVPFPEQGFADIYSGLNYDPDGNLNLAYYSYQPYDSNQHYIYLKYALWNGSNWTIQTIDNKLTNNSDFFALTSVIYDSMGYPHILYKENINHKTNSSTSAEFMEVDVKYASWTGYSWKVETVIKNETAETIPSNLVLDSSNKPRFCATQQNIVYESDGLYRSTDSIIYAYYNGKNWSLSYVDSLKGNCYLHLDRSGRPQIYVYESNNDGQSSLMLATTNGSNWTIQTIGSKNFYSIAFDSNDNPNIIYSSAVGTFHGAERYGNLTYATLQTSTLDNDLWLGAVFASLIITLVVIITITIYRVNRKNIKN
jgi:hypothetical protein